MMKNPVLRTWLVRWLLLVAAMHVVVGAVLPWVAHLPLFDAYHASIEAAFWNGSAPAEGRALQTWWISLFGPTLALMGAWMFGLVQLAGRLRLPQVWLWLIIGLLLWAPHDILVSLRAACWPHVWADAGALIVMLPPLFWLWRHDRAASAA